MSYPEQFPSEPRAKHFRDITIGRIDRWEGYMSQTLFEERRDDAKVISMSVWSVPGLKKATFEEAVKAKGYRPFHKGDSLGPSWSHHWVKMSIYVPASWKKYERVQLEFDPSCEAMIFNVEGLPLQGITGGTGGDRRVEHILNDQARGFAHTLYIEVSCNGMFGLDALKGDPGYADRRFRLASADLVAPRMEAWHLLWDFRVLKDLAKELPDNSALAQKAFGLANEICNVFRHDDLSTITKCRKLAESVFGKGWQDLGDKIYKQPSETPVQVYALSNCHIDTAWLWPFSATQQKVARSWSTQIDLMERYPEHRFVASQAQQFKWLEELYPSLFEKVRAKVAAGSFQPIGGSWVEMDTNMPSGEALVRQFTFGQRYFKTRFGKYCEIHWLPDTFGYSSQLPQLARLAGMKFFFTQKLSWSQFNDFPHTTFNWVGLDGTQVLTHMPPVNTYTAQATVRDVQVSVSRHKSLEQTDLGLLPFGNGDGGGGALAPMIETLRRIRAAANHSRDIPKVDVGSSAEDFYHTILKRTDNGKNLVSWSGELYLEYHRGTYTSHGSIKNHNRRSEQLMRDIEYVATMACLLGGVDKDGNAYVYPKEDIDSLWEDVLLCQFHDVLPGSAIEIVYRDAERIYSHVAIKGAALLEKAVTALHPASVNSKSKRTIGNDVAPYALNTFAHARAELVYLDGVPSQVTSQKATDGHLVLLADVDGSGVAVPVEPDAKRRPSIKQTDNGDTILSNEYVGIAITLDGRITSIVDIEANRELLDMTKTGGFVMYQDRPNNYDAWDADVFHLETPEHLTGRVTVTEKGPLKVSATIKIHYGESTIQSTISLDAAPPSFDASALSLIRFENVVDWQSAHVFLKFELPVAIKSDSATYDTQFGVLSRPTHRNTTWDAAKFEMCAHKFADLSEYGYGVALISNNKYGYTVAGNIMRLSLLRGARYPDRHQDIGTHLFDFAIYPHRGHFLQSDVPAVARFFNAPFQLRTLDSGKASVHQLKALHSPIKVTGPPNVVMETVKRGEDDDYSGKTKEESVIVRFYDAYGGAGTATVELDFDVSKAAIVDLLEREIKPVQVLNDTAVSGKHKMHIFLRAFQVLTLKLWLNKA